MGDAWVQKAIYKGGENPPSPKLSIYYLKIYYYGKRNIYKWIFLWNYW